jgi:Mg2+-importing ATPase
MTASSNFGNVFSVLVASAFIPFPADAGDSSADPEPDVRSPSSRCRGTRWKRVPAQAAQVGCENIGRFMLWIGPTSSIFDITTFALMWYVFAANHVEAQALFQSGGLLKGCCRKRWWCIC